MYIVRAHQLVMDGYQWQHDEATDSVQRTHTVHTSMWKSGSHHTHFRCNSFNSHIIAYDPAPRETDKEAEEEKKNVTPDYFM